MAKVNRETKQVFWDRMDREGRRAEAEKAAAKLSATGLSKREVQEKVVGEFQPLDGTETRAWPTPNAWKCGRKPLPPRSPEERRDLDIIWAAEHFRTNPDSAPSDGKAFWLKAAQKDPDLFDRNHAKDARSRQKSAPRSATASGSWTSTPKNTSKATTRALTMEKTNASIATRTFAACPWRTRPQHISLATSRATRTGSLAVDDDTGDPILLRGSRNNGK